MNKLSRDARILIAKCLTDGCSIRATCRITGVSKGAVTKLLVDLGRVTLNFQDRALRNLPCTRFEVDETWTFVGCKDANIPAERKGEEDLGSVWTGVAICADTKLVPTFIVGRRDTDAAYSLLLDLADRVTSRIQVTTDGHAPYIKAVDDAFGAEVDFAQIVKTFGKTVGNNFPERKYSPGACTGMRKEAICGTPDMAKANTAFAERQNLQMRMNMRRFTRLTNGFSKKADNLACSIALHFAVYNFVRPHSTLKQGSVKRTPAMAAGVTDRVWSMGDIIDLLEAEELDAAGVAARAKAARESANS